MTLLGTGTTAQNWRIRIVRIFTVQRITHARRHVLTGETTGYGAQDYEDYGRTHATALLPTALLRLGKIQNLVVSVPHRSYDSSTTVHPKLHFLFFCQ